MFGNNALNSKPLTVSPSKPGRTQTLTGLGISALFVLGIFLSGCVVHHKHHGRGHGHAHGVKLKPKVGVSVSPMIVIDD